MPSPADIQDPTHMAALGMLPGTDATGTLARRWDKRDDCDPSDFIDLGWIGEDAQGVWTTRHPSSALAQDPKLWGIVTEWRGRTDRDIGRGEYLQRSNFWSECWLALLFAQSREEQRMIKGAGDGDA